MLKYDILSNELPYKVCKANYERYIKLGNYLIIISLTVMTFSIVISYMLTEYFSLAIQITAHISTIITAGIAKIGYVIRCVGAHALGHKVF
jgi:hypothetical protein